MATHVYIQGGPEKTELHISRNMWIYCLASVFEVTSDEKNDTKISKFGSVVCFLWHIFWDDVETQNFPFSA